MDKWILKRKQPVITDTSSQPSTSTSTTCNEPYNDECENETLLHETPSHCGPTPTPAKKAKLVPPKSSSEKLRVYKFKQEWLSITEYSGWLEKSTKKKGTHDLAHCKICDVDLTAHRSEITRHGKGEKHLTKVTEIKKHVELPKMFSSHKAEVKRAEIKLPGLLAVENLPFSLMDTLVPLLQDVAPDSKILHDLCMRRSKATQVVKKSLGKTFLEMLYDKLRRKNCYFSIIMDETTDQSTIKQCALTILYQDDATGSVKTNFFDMFETSGGTAEELYKGLLNSIQSKNIPLDNLIGFSSDTTNVMVGEKNSVFSHLKNDLPHIVCVKCSCHMAHLTASKACLKLPRSVEDLLRNLGSHFSRSYCRQNKFKEFQEFFSVEIHKILYPSITRWLSLKACVDRVLEQYSALQAYLRVSVMEDPSQTTEQMLATMDNKFTQIYLEFMSYTLGILTDFNIMFQSETPLLHKLKPEVEKLVKDICSNFMVTHYIKSTPPLKLEHENPRHFLPIEDIYLGISAQETLATLKQDHELPQKDLDQFLVSCLNFYVELIGQIKKRFNFTDEIFKVVEIVDPPFAQDYKVRSLSFVFKRLPFLTGVVNIQALDSEWKSHALMDHVKEGLDPGLKAQKYWNKVFSMKTGIGKTAFPNLKIVIELLLVLPFSNASVERVFSELTNLKTKQRNKLKTETIVAVMGAREGIKDSGGVVAFDPPKAMIQCSLWTQT